MCVLCIDQTQFTGVGTFINTHVYPEYSLIWNELLKQNNFLWSVMYILHDWMIGDTLCPLLSSLVIGWILDN